jgi:hypothetical protein
MVPNLMIAGYRRSLPNLELVIGRDPRFGCMQECLKRVSHIILTFRHHLPLAILWGSGLIVAKLGSSVPAVMERLREWGRALEP